MKITKLRTGVVHFPFDPPIDGGPLQLRSADCVLVFLKTDAGLVGEGLVFSLNNQRLPVINEMVRSLEPLVLGLDPELGGSFSARAFRDIGFLGRSGVAVNRRRRRRQRALGPARQGRRAQRGTADRCLHHRGAGLS
ncbi:MAG: hypothetical protein WCD67_21445 [Xanthobacteraceae bacterium]